MKLLLFFLFSPMIMASYWTTQKETSYEVKALVESFKMDYMTEEEKKDLKEKIRTLDNLLTHLKEKDHYFISKTSIYKWLLKNKPVINVPADFVLENFDAKAEIRDLSPFPRWLLTALRTDSARLVQEPNYESYRRALAKDPASVKNSSLHKRIAMIKPWLYLFQKEDASQIDLRMMKFHFSILDHVISQLKVFYQFNSEQLPESKPELAYFSFKDQERPKNNEEKTLSILDEVIEKHKKENLPVPTGEWSLSSEDTWLPNEENKELSTIQKINIENPKPSKEYVAPEKLPEPIDDWIWD